MPRFALISLVVTNLFLLPVFSQSERTEVEELRAPGLLARFADDEAERPLPLDALAVDIDLVGPVARTTLTLTFRNPSPRVLEGRFVLPLPGGAYPSAFALDIEGKLRAATIVDRDHGRVVFEEIVRRGVDPGLLEWAHGNAFRARIFPIPASGTRTISITYDQELVASDDALHYRLPLNRTDVLKEFEFSLDVAGTPGTILMTPYGKLGIPASGQTRLSVKSQDITLASNVALRVEPALDDDGRKRAFAVVSETPDGYCFLVDAPLQARSQMELRVQRLGILWDASGSRENSAMERERELIAALCQKLKNTTITVTVFSSDVWFTEDFEVRGGDAGELLALLGSLSTDGASDFAGIAALPTVPGFDQVLLFSDGITAAEAPPLSSFGAPVYSITSSPFHDPVALTRMAVGGAVVDLNSMSTGEAVDALSTRPFHITGANVVVEDAEPPLPAPVTDRVLLRGHLDTLPSGAFEIEVSSGQLAVELVAVNLEKAPRIDGDHVEHLWAAARVRRLLQAKQSGARKSAVVELARKHGLVTPYTSLLVLETLEDYVKYRVTPPADLREQWEAAIEKIGAAEEKSRDERLARVRAQWQERRQWWQGSYEFPKKKLRPDGSEAPPSEQPGFRRVGERDTGAAPDFPAPEGELTAAEIYDQEFDDEDASESISFFGAERISSGAVSHRMLMNRRAIHVLDDSDDGAATSGRHGSPARHTSAEFAVVLAPWQNEALVAQLDEAENAYQRYLEMRKEHGTSAGYYVDVADYFHEKGDPVTALRVLSNLAELKPNDPGLLRIYAHHAAQFGATDLAIDLFRIVLRLRPEEPQSKRDLGLLLARKGEYQQAIELLEAVVVGARDDRFPDIAVITLGELATVVAKIAENGAERHHTIPDDLLQVLAVDVRIVCTWDADQCDIDLHVQEPSGERASYDHRRTAIGGHMSRDFTRGYGPEEYLLKKAMPGKYEIVVHYYGDSRPQLAGSATVQIEIIRDFGRPTEKRTAVTRRLKDQKQYLKIAELEF